MLSFAYTLLRDAGRVEGAHVLLSWICTADVLPSGSVMSDALRPRGLQASLSITNSRSLLKLMSIESVMPSNLLILCCPLLLPFSSFLSIRVFLNESVFCITWPKYWSFSFSISPSNEYSDWFPLGWTCLISLQSKGLSRVFSNPTVQKHQFYRSVQSLSRILLFTTPWTTALQASLSITNSQSLLKFMSIESVIPSNHLILCHPLLLSSS